MPKIQRRRRDVLKVGAEWPLRGRTVVLLHVNANSAFVRTVDSKADQWTAWITRAELGE